MVLGAHTHVPPSSPDWFQFLFGFWGDVGWSGVDLFFVLSGFLVSNLLFNEWKATGKTDVFRFLVRRGYKIYPSFYLYLLFTITIVSPFREELGAAWFKAFFSETFFLQNYVARFWPHTWSLAVEEHFYFALPFVLILFARFSSQPRNNAFRGLPWLIGAVAIAAACMRWLVVKDGVSWFGYAMFPTHLRIDSLFFGVLIAYCFNFHPRIFALSRKARIAGLCLAVACLSPVALLSVQSPWLESFGLTSTYIGFGLLVAVALPTEQRLGHGRPWAAWIGRASYQIYLWHMVCRGWAQISARRAFGESIPWWFEPGAYFAISLGFGYAMTRFFETPLLKYRDRTRPRAA